MASPNFIARERGYLNGVAGALARNVFVNCDTAQSEVILCGANERPVGVTLEAGVAEGDQIRIAERPSIVKVKFAAAAARETATGEQTQLKVGATGFATPVTSSGLEWVVALMDPKSDEPAASGDIGTVELVTPYLLIDGGAAGGGVLQVSVGETRADVGAGATINYDIMVVPTGFQLTPYKLTLQCGTVADCTFSLQADDTDICTPLAGADNASITTFTDTVDAGEVARLEVVTEAGTGDLDAGQYNLFYYLRAV